jgi:hypothetical protein
MPAIDYAELERATYGDESNKRHLRLTPEILGRIITCVWRVYGRADTQAMDQDAMFGFILSQRGEVPQTVRDVLHVENRVDGQSIEEATRMIVGAQGTRMIGRLNPDNTDPIFKADDIQANAILRGYHRIFPKEVEWVRNAVTRA